MEKGWSERRKIGKENVTHVRARRRNVEEEVRGEGLNKRMCEKFWLLAYTCYMHQHTKDRSCS